MFARIVSILLAGFLLFPAVARAAEADAAPPFAESRTPENEAQLRAWLENMVAFHRFTIDEVQSATGLPHQDVAAALVRFNIAPGVHPLRQPNDPLVVLPYPGGRHPRIGFLDGAVRPQRDTKISVFTPWDPGSYVVADVPEAVWSNLGLTYLAHTHVPTLWTEQGIELDKLEWSHWPGGVLDFERTLPNKIRFGTRVVPRAAEVRMEMWLTNNTPQTLSDLRVQNCVMLKGAAGFAEHTLDNKHFESPYAACRAKDADRWIITAWEPCHRAWGNVACPCLHADPKFPDCKPGETVRVKGWLSFYEGSDLPGELRRIDATGWRESD